MPIQDFDLPEDIAALVRASDLPAAPKRGPVLLFRCAIEAVPAVIMALPVIEVTALRNLLLFLPWLWAPLLATLCSLIAVAAFGSRPQALLACRAHRWRPATIISRLSRSAWIIAAITLGWFATAFLLISTWFWGALALFVAREVSLHSLREVYGVPEAGE